MCEIAQGPQKSRDRGTTYYSPCSHAANFASTNNVHGVLKGRFEPSRSSHTQTGRAARSRHAIFEAKKRRPITRASPKQRERPCCQQIARRRYDSSVDAILRARVAPVNYLVCTLQPLQEPAATLVDRQNPAGSRRVSVRR
jgi:hypothetical protein